MRHKWLTGLLCFFLTVPGFGQAVTSTQVFDVPISLSVFVPCAAGGAGELIDVSGPLHVVLSTTVNANNFRVTQSFNPQGVVGTGQTTGDTYHGTGITRFDVTASVNAFPTEFTFVNNFYMIGTTSTGGKLLIHETAHFTVDANGATTVNFDKPSVTCH